MYVTGNQPLSIDEIRTLPFKKRHRLYPLIAARKISLGAKESHTKDRRQQKSKVQAARNSYIYISFMAGFIFRLFF
jgi:hypothetical protein